MAALICARRMLRLTETCCTVECDPTALIDRFKIRKLLKGLEVESWPDGVYESDVYIDHDTVGNRDIHVHVA